MPDRLFEESLDALLERSRVTNPVGPRRIKAYMSNPEVSKMILADDDYNGVKVKSPTFVFKDGERLVIRLWYPSDIVWWKKYQKNLDLLEAISAEIVDFYNQHRYIEQSA